VGVVVPFVYPDWATAYPQFANVTEAQVVGVSLTLAQQYHVNDGHGPINDPLVQTQALWLAVAHVTQLMFGSTNQPNSPLVGRVASAGQGSVNVNADYKSTLSSQWWDQTVYGAAYWQIIKGYSMGFYRAKVTPLQRAWIYGGIGQRRVW
jgi:hypothetical protein